MDYKMKQRYWLWIFLLVLLLGGVVCGLPGSNGAVAQSTGTTTRVSVASDGTQGDGGSCWLSIAADGRYVAFDSYASNLVPRR